MSRYIDADKLNNYIDTRTSFEGDTGEIIEKIKLYTKAIIDAQPTADVVEVVRCVDCRHWENGRCYLLRDVTVEVRDNDFCSYGERADE